MQYMRNISHYLASILFVIFILAGCGSDSQDSKTANPESDLLRGWDEYNSGNDESAILAFEKVLNGNPSTEIAGDAYNGLGWAYLNVSKSSGLNQINLTTALSKFSEAIKHDKTNSDAMVGQASALFVRRYNTDDFQNALKMVDSAQQGNKNYLYRHNYDSEADLHALKAQCYYYLNDYKGAQSEIEHALAIEKENSVALTVKTLINF